MRNEALAEAIRKCRWTIEEAAAELNVNRVTLRRWINGQTPNRRNAQYAAKQLAMPLKTLWPHLVREKSSYDVADTVERCNASEGGCQE